MLCKILNKKTTARDFYDFTQTRTGNIICFKVCDTSLLLDIPLEVFLQELLFYVV